MNPSCETNMDKKRMEVSTEQVLGSNQHLDLSHLALIPSQMNLYCKELEASQAKTISLEVCIDGWNITYKEFQQCLLQGQTNIPKGPVKRQVIEAWKKMKCPTL